MGSPITDQIMQGGDDIPEVIEEYLEHGLMKCIAFNRRGTLLAAGCSNGTCVIWDFETRVIAKKLKDEDCTNVITSVCWSKYGYHILVSTIDKRLILWDVVTGQKVAQTTMELTSLYAQLHPGSSVPSLCLVSPIYSAPLIVDLSTEKSTVLPISISEFGKDSISHIPCCFNGNGDLVYLGNSKGEILIIDHHSIQILAVISTCGAGIKNVVFSRNGMYFLTNSSDRTIRVYENVLPRKDGLDAICKMSEMLNGLRGIEKLKAIGTKSLVFSHECQDSVSRSRWKALCFSGNSEWIIGGCCSEGEHKICIWNSIGHFIKTLNGPKEGLVSLAWHPVEPIVVSLSLTGLVYIWAKSYGEKWSAFYPDFTDLENVEEYVEREDEFDIVPEIVPKTIKAKRSDINQDDEADIVTVENKSVFSDSEMSEEELCFLPSVPCPNIPEQQGNCIEDSQKLEVSNHSCSWTSEEQWHDRQTINHGLNLMEGTEECFDSAANVTHGVHSKRKWRPIEKVLKLLDEEAEKAVKKMNWPNTGTVSVID